MKVKREGTLAAARILLAYRSEMSEQYLRLAHVLDLVKTLLGVRHWTYTGDYAQYGVFLPKGCATASHIMTVKKSAITTCQELIDAAVACAGAATQASFRTVMSHFMISCKSCHVVIKRESKYPEGLGGGFQIFTFTPTWGNDPI